MIGNPNALIPVSDITLTGIQELIPDRLNKCRYIEW